MAPTQTREAQYLLDRFGDEVAALIQYGSTVFGQRRKDSADDFWVVVKDLVRFHHLPAMRAGSQWANHKASAAEHIRLNRSGPNFYAIQAPDLNMKIAVIDLATFVRLCHAETYIVKGRMQKPVRVIQSCPEVDAAVLAARRDGVSEALDLIEERFTFARFLEKLLGLSYRAEIRPEVRRKKIASILETGRAELEAMYRPLLEAHPNVEVVGDEYRDRRAPAAKRRARRATRRRIRRQKLSRAHLGVIWKYYLTHGSPYRYLYLKVRGEIEKLVRGRASGDKPGRKG